MQDIYFEENYGKLYEKVENGKNIRFSYDGPEGRIIHQFVLREIPIELDGSAWYDSVTPYGYGGPLIEKINDGFSKEQLLSAFDVDFEKYCQENNIVAEFVRFHPLFDNATDFAQMYNSQCIRHTLGTNLKDYDEPWEAEFSKSCRKKIRQALRKGITYRVTRNPEDISAFKEIYYSTMDRNNATDYYYFDDEYFDNCLKWFGENIILVEAIYEEKTVAAGFYFVFGKTIHIHLSGTLSEYLNLSPAVILRYACTLWGKENGFEMIHHGGGRSNSPEDSLFIFKKQFAANTEFPFYIGKKIRNKQVYEKLCATRNVPVDTEFFPAYRFDL